MYSLNSMYLITLILFGTVCAVYYNRCKSLHFDQAIMSNRLTLVHWNTISVFVYCNEIVIKMNRERL